MVISEGINTHVTRDVRKVLDPVAMIPERTGAVIFGIAHFNKSSGTDVASLLSGSHASGTCPAPSSGSRRTNRKASE